MGNTLLMDKATKVLENCLEADLRLVIAESCTGGLVSAYLTDIPGSSRVVDRGFVTYSNTSKTDLLGVKSELIRDHGAVSEKVACSMCLGALSRSTADLAVAITGIAGPTGGGGPGKPIGLVHIAVCRRGRQMQHISEIFSGNRTSVRHAAAAAALDLLAMHI